MFNTNKAVHRGVMLLAVIAAAHIAVTFGVPAAHAQGFATGGTSAQGNLNLTLASFAQMFALINTFMHIVLLFTLNILEILLDTSFFTDPFMMSALNSIWVLCRNIMNIIFALMLIGVAIYTIITANSKMITEKIQTFVLAVILVNFSWFFPRVIIDVANVLTSTVYSVPGTLPSFNCTDFSGNPCTAIIDSEILVGKPNPTAAAQAFCGASFGTPDCIYIPGISVMKRGSINQAIAQAGQASAIVSGLLTSFIRIQSIPKIPVALPGAAGASVFVISLQILINIMMTFFIQLAVLLPMIALIVGMFIRIMILWITVAFMPFSFLGFVINGKLGTDIFGFDTNIWKEFLDAAFMPVLVAIPMVIGFILLGTVSQVPAPGGFTWAVPLVNGFASPWPFMWAFAACAIIWTGAFGALSKSKYIGMFTDKIKSFGESTFGAAAQIPLLVPLPVGIGPKGANLGSLFNLPKDAARAINLGTRSKSLISGLNPTGGGGGPAVDHAAEAEKARKDEEHANKIVAAIERLKGAAPGSDARSDALKELHLVIGGNIVGKSEKDTLKDLEKIAEASPGGSKLREKLDDIRKEIGSKK